MPANKSKSRSSGCLWRAVLAFFREISVQEKVASPILFPEPTVGSGKWVSPFSKQLHTFRPTPAMLALRTYHINEQHHSPRPPYLFLNHLNHVYFSLTVVETAGRLHVRLCGFCFSARHFAKCRCSSFTVDWLPSQLVSLPSVVLVESEKLYDDVDVDWLCFYFSLSGFKKKNKIHVSGFFPVLTDIQFI